MYEVKIIDIDHQGRGIGKINNKIIFIPNALPNEIVKCNIKLEKKNYYEGEVVEFIKKDKIRIQNKCLYNCGGCSIQHINYEEQLKYKENKIKNIIKKFTTIEPKINKIIPSPLNYNYRNKITLHVKNNKLGLYKEKTNDLIEVDKCLLVDDKINEIINELKKLNLDTNNEIIIKASKHETMISTNNYIENIENINATTIICNNKVLKGNGYIIEELNNYRFIISNDSFFQINTNQTINLYNKVLEYAKLTGNENVLDLYCGTGTIGIYLSKYVNRIVGVEINNKAVIDANKNKEINNIKNIEFIQGDCKKVIKDLDYKFDVLIIDPPRTGLFKGMIDDINLINPKRIIYVSCEPITLARDLEELNINYNVIEIQPIDMFPNTYHCESVAVLERGRI